MSSLDRADWSSYSWAAPTMPAPRPCIFDMTRLRARGSGSGTPETWGRGGVAACVRAVEDLIRQAREIAGRRGLSVRENTLLDQPAVAMDSFFIEEIEQAIVR